MDQHTFGHRRGVVCAPHAEAVAAGRHILAEGGNALEAMVAMAAASAVACPRMSHIGGDGFWLIRQPSGRVRVIMGAGPSGARASATFYREHGHDTIPERGPLAALTVPGLVGGWALALEAAKERGGRLPLDILLGPAIRLARSGVAVTRGQAKLTAEKFDELKNMPGFAATFLSGGKPPAAGEALGQATLAATLDQLAHAGLDDFYRGDVGREIAADLERIGSPVTRADLEAFRAVLAEPLTAALRMGAIFNTPPPTQGLASLMILALFDRLGVTEAESFDHVHGLVEATKRAFGVRDAYVTDPARLSHAPERCLDSTFLDAELRRIDRSKAARWPARAGKGDSIWMGAADASGLLVSYIQSNHWEFGSGCVLPGTGILMPNRGVSFSLEAKALNALAPGRLPFHTLNPALAVLSDGRVLAYGATGDDGQPQSQAGVFTRYVQFGQPLGAAIESARWLLGRGSGSARTSLRLEARFGTALADRLASAGHEIETIPEEYSDMMGHAGVVVFHPNGTMEGAHDPRANGGAAGL